MSYLANSSTNLFYLFIEIILIFHKNFFKLNSNIHLAHDTFKFHHLSSHFPLNFYDIKI